MTPAQFMARTARRSDGCVIHEGAVGSHGYALAGDPSGPGGGLAHRLAWVLFRGPIPDGLFVTHRCNTKRCVNIEHLKLGTHRENMDDLARGKYHPKRKLSSSEVSLIRSSGETQRNLAARFGVTQKVISNVRRGITYRHDH